MSSSSLGTYTIQGNRGPTGPTGPLGPTGGTGNTGPTGPTGNFGLYIISSSAFTSGITLTLSDGSIVEVRGNFRGATSSSNPWLDVASTPGGNIVSPINTAIDGVLTLKGISAFGSLSLSDDGNNIFVNSTVSATPSELDISGLTSNTLIYLKTNSQISSTTVGVSFDNNLYNGTLTYDNVGNRLSRLNASYKTKYIGPVEKFEDPIYIDCTLAGVFYLNTPIGIAGITGTFLKNETVSITIVPEDENIWFFPDNVYFEEGENYLTCGKSIINLTTTDQGKTWMATVAARGFDINQETCDISNTLGSCCYQTIFGELTSFGSTVCLDYTTREVCDSYFGTFNPLVPCDKACGITGICCTNGNCIENVSPAECVAFNGRFYGGITCGAYDNDPTSTNFGNRLCPNPCEQNGNVGCCVEGNPLGVYLTKKLCEEYFGGIAIQNPQNTNYECCEQSVGVGACCTTNGCVQLNKIDCDLADGIFMGETFRCDEVNCDCVIPTVQFGACCENGNCTDNVKNSDCSGTFFRNRTCDTNPCVSEAGICCKDGTCLSSATNKAACEALCGNWMDKLTINGQVYQFGSNSNDCQFCTLSRPILQLTDIGSCFPTPIFTNLKNDAHDTNSFGEKCCVFDPLSPTQCYDLYFNEFDIQIPYFGNNTNTRDIALELMTCPLTSAAESSIFSLANQMLVETLDRGVSINGNCIFNCHRCSDGAVDCQSIPSNPSIVLLCTPESPCGVGYAFGVCNPNGCGTVIGQVPGSGDTSGSDTLPSPRACLNGYCDNPQSFLLGCGCTQRSGLINDIINAKIYLNTTDYICVPISCTDDCSDYELCEES